MVQFLSELIARLFSSKPWFFKVVQIAALIVGSIGAVVAYLQAQQGLVLPGFVAWIGSTTAIVSSFIAAIIAQLPKKDDAQK